jgi:hypothetical protein
MQILTSRPSYFYGLKSEILELGLVIDGHALWKTAAAELRNESNAMNAPPHPAALPQATMGCDGSRDDDVCTSADASVLSVGKLAARRFTQNVGSIKKFRTDLGLCDVSRHGVRELCRTKKSTDVNQERSGSPCRKSFRRVKNFETPIPFPKFSARRGRRPASQRGLLGGSWPLGLGVFAAERAAAVPPSAAPHGC